MVKLKGESNFRTWKTQFFNGLAEQSQIYERILKGTVSAPVAPLYEDLSDDNVDERAKRDLMTCKEGLNYESIKDDPKYDLTPKQIRKMYREMSDWNEKLKTKHFKAVENWSRAHSLLLKFPQACIDDSAKALIQQCRDHRDAFQLLESQYGGIAYQSSNQRFAKLHSLTFNGRRC
jgi:hypothetical protein